MSDLYNITIVFLPLTCFVTKATWTKAIRHTPAKANACLVKKRMDHPTIARLFEFLHTKIKITVHMLGAYKQMSKHSQSL